MTLDTAALRWGQAVLRAGEDKIGRDTVGFDDRSTRLYLTLAGIGIPGCGPWLWTEIDLACVMYAQDVAEGRHG